MTHNFFSDMVTLYNGMGDKVATSIQWTATFFTGTILCFVKGWELTLVVLAISPAIAIVGGIAGRVSALF